MRGLIALMFAGAGIAVLFGVSLPEFSFRGLVLIGLSVCMVKE